MNPYKLHDLLELPRDMSLCCIGVMDVDDLQTYQKRFETVTLNNTQRFSVDFPGHIPLPREHSFLFGMKKNNLFDSLLLKYFPQLSTVARSQFHISANYVHVHDDTHNSQYGRGQLMFVLKNDVRFVLFSKNDAGKVSTHIPMAGDIVFLDSHCKHALLPPPPPYDVTALNENPLTFSGMILLASEA